jgi:hypothetical protein
LNKDLPTRFLGVRVPVILSANFEEICLSGRAGIFAPETLHIDGTDVAASRFSTKDTIKLLETLEGTGRTKLVAAVIFSNVFLARLY